MIPRILTMISRAREDATFGRDEIYPDILSLGHRYPWWLMKESGYAPLNTIWYRDHHLIFTNGNEGTCETTCISQQNGCIMLYPLKTLFCEQIGIIFWWFNPHFCWESNLKQLNKSTFRWFIWQKLSTWIRFKWETLYAINLPLGDGVWHWVYHSISLYIYTYIYIYISFITYRSLSWKPWIICICLYMSSK